MLEAREHKAASTDDLVKMARFVLEATISNLMVMLKNKFQEQRLVQSLYRLTRVYLWIILKFLQSQSLQPLVWFRYIDDIFFIWTHGKRQT